MGHHTFRLGFRAAPALVLLASLAGPAAAGDPRPTLPGGGRTLFPNHRVVAYYGAAQTAALGVLGSAGPDAIAARVQRRARDYSTRARPAIPAFELIVTIAHASPGRDGDYSGRTSDATVERYLRAARRAGALLILDFQPGRAPFLPQVKSYERFLREPDVGVALDPEWRVGPGQVPGRVIGQTNAATINAVSAYLSDLVKRHDLPQKLLVVHQFTRSMVVNRDQVVPRDGLAITFHADGFGSPALKRSTYSVVRARKPFFNGFKVFYTEDRGVMAPAQVLALEPPPDLITYQ